MDEREQGAKIIPITEKPFSGTGGVLMLGAIGLGLVLTRILILGAVLGLILLVIIWGMHGFLITLAILAVLGLATEWRVRHRQLKGSMGGVTFQDRVGDDPEEEGRFTSAYTGRPEPIVHDRGERFSHALLTDVAGIVIGTGVFVLVILLLSLISRLL
jgi:hypothetical protein